MAGKDSMTRKIMIFYRVREKWGRDKIRRSGTANVLREQEKERAPAGVLLRVCSCRHATSAQSTRTPAPVYGRCPTWVP